MAGQKGAKKGERGKGDAKGRQQSVKRSDAPTTVAGWESHHRDALFRVVKEAQKRGLAGSKGTFKEFLKATLKKSGLAWKMDPALHNWRTLAAFAGSLREGGDRRARKAVRRHRRWETRRLYSRQLSAWQAQEDREAEVPPHTLWGLVKRTEAHLLFAKAYTFPSHERGWVLTKRAPRHAPAPGEGEEAPTPSLLAVDCEMCDTTAGPRQLLGVSVVDGKGEVLLKTLVKPKGEVLDLKEHITGITRADLEGVTTTLRDVQRSVRDLLQPNTILVGHSLFHDLAALKIDHRPVIDTSLVFSYKGLSRSVPGLSDLSRILLGSAIRQNVGGIHDSAEDAGSAMRLVLHEAEHGPTPSLDPPDTKVAPGELKKLLVHRIPNRTPRESILALFPGQSELVIEGALEKMGGGRCTVTVCFPTVDAANAAFTSLGAPPLRDSLGRPQKTVPLHSPGGGGATGKGRKAAPAGGGEGAAAAGEGGGEGKGDGRVGPVVCVRKMAAHGGAVFGSDHKPARGKRPQRNAPASQGAEEEEGGGGAEGGGGEKPKKKKRRRDS